MRRPLTVLLLVLLFVPFAWSAQLPEDAGPFPVGQRDLSFSDTIFGQGTIPMRFYYPALAAGSNTPADPSGGPYPVVGFMHGWTQSAADFDNLCTHLASHGLVVASTNSETGLFPDRRQLARDTRSALHWVEARSDQAGHWLEGMADGEDWFVAGNSMGALSLMYLIDYEPRVRAIFSMAPPLVSDESRTNLQNWGGRAYFLTGTDDNLVPTGDVGIWYGEAGQTDRRMLYRVVGAGHGGPSDTPGGGGEAMPGAEQFRIARRLSTVALQAETRGLEDLFFFSLGEGGAGTAWQLQQQCRTPVFWADLSVSTSRALAVGLGGVTGDEAIMAWSLVSASIPTPAGILGLDLASGRRFFSGMIPAAGYTETVLLGRAGWRGRTLYLQGYVVGTEGRRLSRVSTFEVP